MLLGNQCALVSEPAVGPSLCESVSGLVRKPDLQKNSIQGSQVALCPSDVNKKVMLTMCFSCFAVPVLKET
jgi:hypothetical protein